MIAVIGAFDGFHKGHQQLFARARELAKQHKKEWGVVTFDTHPQRLFGGTNFHALFMEDERTTLGRYCDIPVVHKIPFTRAVADMTPLSFLDFLEQHFDVDGIVVGDDFRFGRARSGTPAFLSEECARRGWLCDIMPLAYYAAGLPLSSTEIRRCIEDGNPALAWEMLGYPFFYSSKVVHGDKRGHALGFPTANLALRKGKILPMAGVYATLVFVEGEWKIGATSIGRNPTFLGIKSPRFEVNIVGGTYHIYDCGIHVFLLEYMRGEQRFETPYELMKKIEEDVRNIRRLAKNAQATHAAMWEKFAKLLHS